MNNNHYHHLCLQFTHTLSTLLVANPVNKLNLRGTICIAVEPHLGHLG